MKVIECSTKKKYEELEAAAAAGFADAMKASGCARYSPPPEKGAGGKYRFWVEPAAVALFPAETIVDFDGELPKIPAPT